MKSSMTKMIAAWMKVVAAAASVGAVVSPLIQRMELARDRAAARGLSESEVSVACGRSRTWLNKALANGVEPRGVEVLEQLARVAGVSERWLLTGAGSPDAAEDALAPSVTDEPEPYRKNIPGWDDALALARMQRPHYPAWAWERASRSAPFLVDGPPSVGAVLALAQTALELGNPQLAEERERARREAEREIAALARRAQRPARKPARKR